MNEKRLCRYCGNDIPDGVKICPNCGALVDDAYSVGAGGTAVMYDTAVQTEPEREIMSEEAAITNPQTIEELQKYCAQKGMPLLRMRFFIGEDYKEPKAFGIYRDGSDFVVYKNKDTGVRAIRYRGPDEAYAVNEIYEKLLSECHKRGIYPNGESAYTDAAPSRGYKTKGMTKQDKKILVAIGGFFAALIIFAAGFNIGLHRHDGYYQDNTGRYYYRYGNEWSYYDTGSSTWYDDVSFPYDDYSAYSVGEDWDSGWGISDVETSSVWDSWHTSSSYDSDSSSSWDSWDSSGTDWGSDW